MHFSTDGESVPTAQPSPDMESALYLSIGGLHSPARKTWIDIRSVWATCE